MIQLSMGIGGRWSSDSGQQHRLTGIGNKSLKLT